LSKPCKHPENNVNPKTYSLHINLAEDQHNRCIGQIPAGDMAALEVCMLACVSLLCGLQYAAGRPRFYLRCRSSFSYETTLAMLKDHAEGWVDTDGEPVTVEAL
jgi:hypothetical protein